jgi:hypothetical protein
MRRVTQRWPWPLVISTRPRARRGFRRGPSHSNSTGLRTGNSAGSFPCPHNVFAADSNFSPGGADDLHGMPIMHHLVGMNRDKLGTYDPLTDYSACVGPHVDRNVNFRKTRVGEAFNQE